MYKIILFILIISFFSCSKQEVGKIIPKAQKGVLDLRDWDFNEDGLINLNGEWEFYWEQLLSSEDISNPKKVLQKELIQVPKNWKGKEINGKKIDQFGYATYRLKVLLNDNSPGKFSFSVMYIPTASNIFVNGELVSKHGVVGTTDKETKPGFVNKIIDYTAETDSLDIIIQVSNFQFYKAGLAYSIQLGEVGQSNRKRTTKFGVELFFLGAIFIMAIFFIGFYIYRPIDKSSLYFGIFCLLIATYSFFVGLSHLMFLDNLAFNFQTNIIRYTAYLFPFILIMFFKEIFPKEHKKWSIYLLVYPSIAFAVLTLILPISISSPLIIYYRYIIILIFIYLTYVIIKAIKKKRAGAKTLLSGFSFLFLFIFNDILYHAEIIKSSNLFFVGVFIFIISLSYYLSAKFAMAFNKSERLSLELNQVNENLEDRISKRILEISQQKEEITAQAEELRTTNDKLLEIDQFKESLIHMIAHDLKNPLNIIYSLPDMLSPGDDINIMKRAASQMLHLITNMLDVQKYENSTMKLNSTDLILTEIVTEAINQTNYLYSEKEIQLINNINTELKIFADREIIERVFVNLLTNAVKFTPKNGKITVDASIGVDGMVQVSVKDTGIGISKEMLENIFNKFAQIIAKKSGQASSTGLGLAFCKVAVEAHKGEIWAESTTNEGATFYFTLPIAEM
ncbi:MAG: hypothetical protein DRJ07_13795 [Bacteroidetes bacterium]|nr:MAG: hypothetical protein DRJ07_13795 [Bacteroidota bacterium]